MAAKLIAKPTMKTFLEILKLRNEPLFYFGLLCLILAVAFAALSYVTSRQILGINAWIKPLKFALSIGIFSWTMGWYTGYLGDGFAIKAYSWSVVILLGFEIVYIAIQAGRGQLSHFNISTPFYGIMYNLMAIAAAGVSFWTIYIGALFFTRTFPDLTEYYVWSIRLGIILFVIFSFQGFAMGAKLAHTVGGPDGGSGLPLVNWSTKFGDLRIAHFVGMHALQVLPLLAHYLLKNTVLTILLGLLYGALAVFVFVQALQGRPFIKG